jgi:hypothetical protein
MITRLLTGPTLDADPVRRLTRLRTRRSRTGYSCQQVSTAAATTGAELEQQSVLISTGHNKTVRISEVVRVGNRRQKRLHHRIKHRRLSTTALILPTARSRTIRLVISPTLRAPSTQTSANTGVGKAVRERRIRVPRISEVWLHCVT